MPKKPIEQATSDHTLNLVLDTLKISKQALVFVNTKRSAEKTAEEIAKKLKTKDVKLKELSEEMLNALPRPTKQCERLSFCVKKGIAFHHAGLVAKQRNLIEENFRNGLIKIICCTPTLAYGLDLPAFRSILKDLRRYGPRGLTFIPVLEYLQMAGRAGRPKFDKYGEAIAIASTQPEKKKIEEMYINGEPEDIFSKLAVEPVLRTYLLSLIATNFTNTKEQIIGFFSKTFWAFQFADMGQITGVIERMLLLLEEWEFITPGREKSDFRPANEIGNESYKATILGKRVAELYIDPYTAHFIMGCLRKAANKQVKSFSFLQAISHTLEIKPLLNTRVKEQDKMQEELLKYSDCLLEEEPSMYEPEYEDFINSIKTALFFNDWINEKDEEYLLEEYNIRPGEIRAKLDIADWLLYSTEELVRILNFQELRKEVVKLRLRMKHGAKEELLPLLQLRNIGRIRARKLYFNEIKDIADVKKADLMKLAQVLGKNIALDVKKQVGQDFGKIKVKENKRKGQISLKDY